MKVRLRIVGVVVTTALLVGTAMTVVHAESEVPGQGQIGIAVNPNAAGTKVSGALTIVADALGPSSDPNCASGLSGNFLAVLKLSKGNTLNTFSGVGIGLCFGDVAAQGQMVAGLVTNVVIPTFFSNIPAGACLMPACFEVKSLANIIPNVPASGSPPGISMDIILAVHP
jgi:hypothetical protein